MGRMRFAEAGAVRAVLDGERRTLEVLAIPFGGPDRVDRLGQYFTPKTDIMMAVGEVRPLLYLHGMSPNRRMMRHPPAAGTATLARWDESGGWMRAELNGSDLANRQWDAAMRGDARASTGSVNYLVRPPNNEDGSIPPGPVELWPLAELSIFDKADGVPVSDDAVVLPLRSLFSALDLLLPEVFEADEAEDTEEPERALILEDEVNPMDNEEIEKIPEPEPVPVPPPPVLPAKAQPTPVLPAKAQPKYRATFAVNKETVGEPADNDKKESWEWFWHMRHGITKGPSMRVLEETEAAEGGPMVPQDALGQILAQRNESSVASRAGLKRYTTDKLVFNIPREVTAMTRLAAIGEEGAYIANEAAFGTLAITVQKCGSLITATEELLEDQNLFMPWFVEACGRAWALAENADLYTAADVITNGTVAVTGSDTLTTAEFNTFLYFMATPYRDNAVMICHPGTMAAISGLLVATPYAFGAYPDAQRNPLGLPNVNGIPIHLCSDWIVYTGAAALGLVLSMMNRDLCGIVERRGMTIKVDPYGDALNGRIRYFPSVRFAPFFSQALAHAVKNGV